MGDVDRKWLCQFDSAATSTETHPPGSSSGPMVHDVVGWWGGKAIPTHPAIRAMVVAEPYRHRSAEGQPV